MNLLVIALVGAVVTCAFAPLIRHLLISRQILDVPNHRSSHSTPVPRGGGLACLLGLLASVMAARFVGVEISMPAVIAATALCAVGFVDDLRSLPAIPRLILQILIGLTLGGVVGGVWPAVFAAVLFPVVVNVVNFMDGINGISGAVLLVWGVAAVVLGTTQGMAPLAVLGAVALGTASGFLPWNVPHARLFLGDSGSYLMGGLIAAGVTIATPVGIPSIVLLSPLALYAGDVALTLLKRKVRGEQLMQAHRDHAYQRLVSVGGMSHLRVTLVVASGSAAVASAWLLVPFVWALLTTAAMVGGFLVLPKLTETVH